MKATQRDFARLAPRAAASARIFFLCGPDEAGTYAAAETIVSLLREPGERLELSGSDLRKDPVRLGDEARSNSLFGETRHILARVQGDEACDAVTTLVESTVETCPVVIVATGATDRSRTAKLLAPRADALVAMFYPPELADVTAAVRSMADAAGLRIDGDIAGRLARGANLDVRLAQSEVAKLALYLDAAPESPRTVDAETLDAISATSPEDGFAALVDAVLGGASQRIAPELQRLDQLRLNPVGLLLAFERRAAQLAALAAKLQPGVNPSALVKSEAAARRVYHKDQDEITNQLRRWRGRPLERLCAKLVELHRQLLHDSQNAHLLIAQGLAEIARVAVQRR